MPLSTCRKCKRSVPEPLLTGSFCQSCRKAMRSKYGPRQLGRRPNVPPPEIDMSEPIKYSPEYRRFVQEILLDLRTAKQ